MDLWQKSKDQYRARYYMGGPGFESKETIFGKRFAKMMEDSIQHPVADMVPRGDKMEYKILQEIQGVPVLGYLDSFDTTQHFVYEFKTGKEKWSNLRVAKHDQLVVYSLLVKKKHGHVDPFVRLTWIETKNCGDEYMIGGVKLTAKTEIDFTGHVETFKRRIVQWERDKMEEKIRRIAEEITEDYTKFLEKNNG